MDKCAGLYIHIPFCKRKCRYCDFVSFTDNERYFDRYISAVESEAGQYSGVKIETLFIGGGTPTLLEAKQLERLIGAVNKSFDMSVCTEASIEANPGTITEEKLRALKACGINRISIGVQSFSDDELKMLGRIHSAREAYEAIEKAAKYFDNINIDIMTALPGQTAQRLLSTVKSAVSCGASHLSCYSLIIEDGTEFKELYDRGELKLPGEDEDRDMFSLLCEYLRENGYERYEISNFAKPGFRCCHNMKYWTANEYIGLGVSAHSYFGGVRYYNCSSLEKYLSGKDFCTVDEKPDPADKKEEFIMLSLRTADGVDEAEYKSRFSEDFYKKNAEKINKFISAGFMKKTRVGYGFTDKGFDISNTLICELI